jgi:hypothetical protein
VTSGTSGFRFAVINGECPDLGRNLANVRMFANDTIVKSLHWLLCTGCGRTVAEIGEWGGATAERQCAILTLLPKRLAQIAAGQAVMR